MRSEEVEDGRFDRRTWLGDRHAAHVDHLAVEVAVDDARVDVRAPRDRRRVPQVLRDDIGRLADRSFARPAARRYPAFSEDVAASTVACQVRKSFAEKSPPAVSLM